MPLQEVWKHKTSFALPKNVFIITCLETCFDCPHCGKTHQNVRCGIMNPPHDYMYGFIRPCDRSVVRFAFKTPFWPPTVG